MSTDGFQMLMVITVRSTLLVIGTTWEFEVLMYDTITGLSLLVDLSPGRPIQHSPENVKSNNTVMLFMTDGFGSMTSWGQSIQRKSGILFVSKQRNG